MTIGDDAIMARETFASFVRVAERLARLYVVPYALFLQKKPIRPARSHFERR